MTNSRIVSDVNLYVNPVRPSAYVETTNSVLERDMTITTLRTSIHSMLTPYLKDPIVILPSDSKASCKA